ncbi:hypothetical protein TRIATDRAFT_320112 [Trichoderma atroviride IMI 206040]|uniref:SSCRP protein n=1 Tax=Hypocrea atroviridis (strain ATCC 20476 / IMI 206040) TaxID=452589 RepID=G9P2S1_HYPAI|nr:uncharacterized protein TRIATDRAFT_320112 [Trichoderma atroviride IMI 206040]EHK42749.1 hypothetical protein TRIATDRAFT_320112 [Trichoderma atroviride IMI 206040]
MASIAKTLAVLAFSLGFSLHVSASGSHGGNLDFYSDDKCQDRIQAEAAPIPLDVCMPASPLGSLSRSFRVSQKPYCADGTTRPSLLFFQDCACTDGIANYIPDALYGDYGNGSCNALWGGEYLMFALSCGEFKAPVRSVISFASTFPGPSPTTTKPVGCPPLGSGASATATATATGGGGDDDEGATATAGGVMAAPTSDGSSSSSPTMTGTRTKVDHATSANSQTAAAATTSSAAVGRHDAVGLMYWTGFTAIFGAVLFLAL